MNLLFLGARDSLPDPAFGANQGVKHTKTDTSINVLQKINAQQAM
jgi:hypothetical protein